MRFVLVYFSGTGNTKTIAEALADELTGLGHGVELLPVERLPAERDRLTGLLDGGEVVLGVGFPVYKFTFPRIMERLLGLLDTYISGISGDAGRMHRRAFVFATYCRFAASSVHDMASELERRRFTPIALDSFKCPSNGIVSLHDPDSFEYRSVMYFEARIQRHVTAYARSIVSGAQRHVEHGYGTPHRPAPLHGLKRRIVERVENARYPILSIDHHRCVACGRCAGKCPERNLQLVDGKIEIRDTAGCLHCLRCLHICPAHAVSFGELVVGPNRYTGAVLRRLYRLATVTPAGTKELGTRQVRRRWARANIRYWLTHRPAGVDRPPRKEAT